MQVISLKWQLLIYGVSDRAAASILNTYLAEEGIVTATDTSRVIDLNLVKLWKSRIYQEPIPTKFDNL